MSGNSSYQTGAERLVHEYNSGHISRDAYKAAMANIGVPGFTAPTTSTSPTSFPSTTSTTPTSSNSTKQINNPEDAVKAYNNWEIDRNTYKSYMADFGVPGFSKPVTATSTPITSTTTTTTTPTKSTGARQINNPEDAVKAYNNWEIDRNTYKSYMADFGVPGFTKPEIKQKENELNQEYDNLSQKYDELVDNSQKIANQLQDFVVNNEPIGSDVYKDETKDNSNPNEISLPTDTAEVNNAITKVNNDKQRADRLNAMADRLQHRYNSLVSEVGKTEGNKVDPNVVNEIKDYARERAQGASEVMKELQATKAQLSKIEKENPELFKMDDGKEFNEDNLFGEENQMATEAKTDVTDSSLFTSGKQTNDASKDVVLAGDARIAGPKTVYYEDGSKKITEGNTEYNYDNKANLLSTVKKDANGNIFSITPTAFSSLPNYSTTVHEDGSKTVRNGNTEYHYDKQGGLLSTTQNDVNGKLFNITPTAKSALPSYKTQYFEDGTKRVTQDSIQYNYDKNGNLLSKIQYDAYGNILNLAASNRSKLPNISTTIFEDGSRSVNRDGMQYNYDSKGILLSKVQRDIYGNILNIDSTEQSSLPNIKTQIYEDGSKSVTVNGARYNYDIDGNLLSIVVATEEGKQMIETTEFSDLGRLLAQQGAYDYVDSLGRVRKINTSGYRENVPNGFFLWISPYKHTMEEFNDAKWMEHYGFMTPQEKYDAMLAVVISESNMTKDDIISIVSVICNRSDIFPNWQEDKYYRTFNEKGVMTNPGDHTFALRGPEHDRVQEFEAITRTENDDPTGDPMYIKYLPTSYENGYEGLNDYLLENKGISYWDLREAFDAAYFGGLRNNTASFYGANADENFSLDPTNWYSNSYRNNYEDAREMKIVQQMHKDLGVFIPFVDTMPIY